MLLDVARTHSSRDGVLYLHHLDCGHIERRKRPSTNATVACVACGEHLATELALHRLPTDDPRFDPVVAGELEGARLRAAIAKVLGVPLDAVSVSTSPDGSLAGAMVWLHAAAARELADRVVKPSDPM